MNTVILTASALIINTMNMVFNVYISNRMGAETIGLIQLMMSVYALAVTLACSGINLAVTRLVAEELAVGNEGGMKKAVRICVIHALIFSSLACVSLLCSAQFIATYWLKTTMAVRPLRVLSLTLPFISLSTVFSGYFTAVKRIGKSALANIFIQFIRIGTVTALMNFVFAKDMESSCIAIVTGGLISEMLALLINFIHHMKDKKQYESEKCGSCILKRTLNISLPIALSSYIRSSLGMFKNVITPLRMEKSGIGVSRALAGYGVVRGMVMPMLLFPSSFLYAFSSLLVPELATRHIKGESENIRYATAKIFKYTLIFSILVCGIIFGFAEDLGKALYKNEDVSLYIKLLTPLIPVMYFDSIVDGLLKGLNEQVAVVRINIADTVLTILLSWFLLPLFGMNGYIIIIYISEFFNAFLSMKRLLKATNVELKIIDWIIKPLISVTASVVVAKFLNVQFNVQFIAGICMGISLYILLLFALRVIGKDDIGDLFSKKTRLLY